MSGPAVSVRRSPWSVSFPPRTPPPLDVRHCSPASQVLRDCLTSRPCFILRRGACRHCGISPSPTDPRPKTWMFPGSPNFREECFQPCAWPLTPWGRNRTRLVFRSTSLSPSPCCDKVGHHKMRFSELNTRPGLSPVNASIGGLPHKTHHSEPR